MNRDRAVSEAIGGILLLSLVVIGITMVGIIIFSQPLPGSIPSLKIIATSTIEQDGTSDRLLTLTHDGGDILNKDELRIEVNGLNISDANVSICSGGTCGPFEEPWSLGKSLQITTPTDPRNLSLIFLSGSSETLFYSTSKFVNQTPINPGTWYNDTTPPVISSVTVTSSTGTPPPIDACSNANIHWVASDNQQLKSVKIEYYDGTGWSTIKDPNNPNPPYNWLVSKNAGSGKLIRVTARDLAGNTATATSSPFTIQDTTPPSISITSPAGGEIWMIGSKHSIAWTASDCDTVGGVIVSLSTNNGGIWTDIATNQLPNGNYQWEIPNDAGLLTTNALIRINASDPSANIGSTTSHRFTIGESDAPVVNLIAPDGGETWEGGSYQTIRWTAVDTSGISQVSLEFTTDAGVNWSTITTGLSNTGSYVWTVNDIPTHSAKVKVTATDNSGNNGADVSTNLFTIVKGTGLSVLVITPNGGESLVPGNNYNVTWNAAPPTIQGVNISFSSDNGLSYSPVMVNGPHNNGLYTWSVPSSPTTKGRIKIEANNDKSQYGSDISDGIFTIINAPSSVVVTSPNGGESWNAHSNQTIKWTASDPDGINSQDVSYSINNGVNWISLATGLSNTTTQYAWTLPNTTSTTALVRVTVRDTWGATTSDQSNAVFEIKNAPPSVTLISPNGGQNWGAGSIQQITWNATDEDGITGIDLAYSLNGGFNWNTIVGNTGNTGSYNWTIPSSSSTTVKVKVTARDSTGNSNSDSSDAVFAIVISPPQVTVTYPNGGETWNCGSSQTITWTATDTLGISSIDLAYSLNNNPLTTPIAGATGIANTGSFTWAPIPNTPSTQVKVVATAHNTAGNVATDTSNSFFEIKDSTIPVINIIDPQLGVAWSPCSSGSCPSKITWAASDNVDVVRIDLFYSKDNQASWPSIIASLSNNGYYYWYVPSPGATNAPNSFVKAIAYDSSGNTAEAISSKFTITK